MTDGNSSRHEGERLYFGVYRTQLDQAASRAALIAAANTDKRLGNKGEEAEARARRAKNAAQTEKNPLDGTASLTSAEKTTIKTLNRLLTDNREVLMQGASAAVAIEIAASQLTDIQRAIAEQNTTATKATGSDPAFVTVLEKAGCTAWERRQLAESDLRYIAAFIREKAADPRHRNADGIGMAAFRAGYLDLSVEGLGADEQLVLLMAASPEAESDLAAKAMFEEAAGRSLDISPTLAGALARAAEIRRPHGAWPHASHTVDHAAAEQLERDLQTILAALGIGEEAQERAWNVLLPVSTERKAQDAAASPTEPVFHYQDVARQMLAHVHGDETDRWEKVMANVGMDTASRLTALDRVRPVAERSPQVRIDWEGIVMAANWRPMLALRQNADVLELATLLQDGKDERWLAQMRGIDLPEGVTAEPPLLRAAQLLQQPLEEIVWELFDQPPITSPPPFAATPSTGSRRSAHNGAGPHNYDY